jgi:hypothetical protein
VAALSERPTVSTTDATIDARFREMFREPLSSSKCEAMLELYPMLGARGRRRLRLD